MGDTTLRFTVLGLEYPIYVRWSRLTANPWLRNLLLSMDPSPVDLCNEGTGNPLLTVGTRCRGYNRFPVCGPNESSQHACGCRYRNSADHPREHPTAMRAVQREGGLLDVNVKGGLTKKKTYARETGGMDVRRRGETMAQRASIELLTLLNLVWTEAKLIELEPIRDLLRRYGDVRDRLLKAARSITVSKEALEQNLWVPSYNQGGRGTELICRLKALPKHRVIFIVGEVFAKQESLSPRGDGAFEIKLIQMLNTPIVLSNQLAEEFLNSFPTLKCFRPNGRIWIIGKIYLAEGGSIHFDSISGFRTQLKYIPIDSVNEGLVFDKADSERRHVRKPLKIDQNPENGPFTPDIQFLDCEDYERYPGEVYQGRKDDPGYVPHVQEKEAYYLGNRWAWFVEKEPVMPEFPPRRAQ